MNKLLAILCCLLQLTAAAAMTRAQDPGALPARPTQFFNDFAVATRSDTRETLNHRLADFERQTSNQLLVAIYPKLPDGAEVADYAQRVFRAWQPGQAGRDNGAILFVFLQNRKVWIQTGRGLEGALPDAVCRRIIADGIAPRFKANDYDGGLTAGVDAMIAAAKGEYQGTGRTVADARGRRGGGGFSLGWVVLLMLGFYLFATATSFFRRGRRGQVYGADGYRGVGGSGPIFLPMGGGFGGGGGGDFGGGGGGGSNDSFSGGGGDSGGGGAGGDW